MLRLGKIVKGWKDGAAQCDQINLCGFWNRGPGLPLASRATGINCHFPATLRYCLRPTRGRFVSSRPLLEPCRTC